MSRLILVSNRVPSLNEKAEAGGLAVALSAALQEAGGLWFGWSGRTSLERSATPRLQDAGSYALATLDLTKSDTEGYYKGFANRTLWPLFHNRLCLYEFGAQEYETYCNVNRYFARQIKKFAASDDLIWTHDYHLIPLADELRKSGVTALLGFFLHIPFPPLETMLTLPVHRELVQMLLRYDLIGFQTKRDLRNFFDYVEQELGGSTINDDQVCIRGKVTRVGAFPISIDIDAFSKLAESPAAKSAASKLRASRGDQSWIVGVDRLDYTKGLAEKLRAYETFLERHSQYHRRVQLVQIAALSRETLPEYINIRNELESVAGEINGRFGVLDWTPLKCVNRAYSLSHISALYRCSRVALVTPLRDGMNLVAKEYVAAQDPEDPGVLVLSQFAGAAAELGEGAVLVNPYNTASVAESLRIAIDMPLAERQERWRKMMGRIKENDIHRWRSEFLKALWREANDGGSAAVA